MTNQQADCEYISHDNGFHEFIYHVASRQAVNIQLETAFKIVANLEPDEQFVMLTDLTESGIPPLRYAMQRTRELFKVYFVGSPINTNPTYIAYVVTSNSIIQTFKFFVEQLGRGKISIKVFNERESAMAWLELITHNDKENAV